MSPQQPTNIRFEELAKKLSESGTVTANPFLLRLELSDPDFEVTVFRDGRAIIKGTDDMGIARAIYSRFIGL